MRPGCRLAALLASSLVSLAATVDALGEPGRAGAPPGSAAPGSAERSAEAHERYEEGVEAYRKGRYAAAIGLFTEAEMLVPSAALSFDIARAYEKLHDPSNAVTWYRDYLQRAGFVPDRADIERRIAMLDPASKRGTVRRLSVSSSPASAALSLDGRQVGITPWSGDLTPGTHRVALHSPGYVDVSQTVWLEPDAALDLRFSLSQVKAPAPDAPVVEKAPPEPLAHRPETVVRRKPSRPNPLRTSGYVAVGVGGAAIGGAVVFELLRRKTESEVGQQANQVSYAEKYDTMRRQQTASRVLAGTGAALAATGAVLLLVGNRSHEATEAVSIGCLPGACSASVQGRF